MLSNESVSADLIPGHHVFQFAPGADRAAFALLQSGVGACGQRLPDEPSPRPGQARERAQDSLEAGLWKGCLSQVQRRKRRLGDVCSEGNG